MAWTVEQEKDGSVTLVASGSSKGSEVKIDFGNSAAGLGRTAALGVASGAGAATYLRLTQSDGTAVYIASTADETIAATAGVPANV